MHTHYKKVYSRLAVALILLLITLISSSYNTIPNYVQALGIEAMPPIEPDPTAHYQTLTSK